MERTITCTIKEEDAGIRVEQFLRRKSYSTKSLAQLKAGSSSTRINGKDCRLIDRLSIGDLLEVHISEVACSEKIPATALPLSIVYEDEDILVVDKPAGLPMHPSKDNYYYSLANAVMYYYRNCNGFIFRCTSRLDRDTSGLTVIAKHFVSAGILSSMVKGCGMGFDDNGFSGNGSGSNRSGSNDSGVNSSGNRSIANSGGKAPGSISGLFMEREYTAIVCGAGIPASGAIDAPLSRKQPCRIYPPDLGAEPSCPLPERSIERCVDFENGERAVTHYRTLERNDSYSLVSILLETGRTHQIRVHMAHLGYPLAGDYLYNPACRRAAAQAYFELPAAQISGFQGRQTSVKIPCISVPESIRGISRQALHASRLKFTHPISGKIMEFSSPLPEDMQAFGFSQVRVS
ncbi:MAG: RluA family pseudouridine synthase [Lachnospiraceae bacterium]|nr:RluA family pseudouridine synthase [Lachnospiraceae bacterium]